MSNIVLTGFMASGKTEISKQIARLTGRTLVDTDALIVEREGSSVTALFDQKGEAYFRDAETRAVLAAAAMNHTVIATGGGAVLREENRKALRKTGVVFCLSPDFETIKQRLEKARAGRPLLQGQSLEQVRARYQERLPYYRDCDYEIPVSNEKTPEDYARQIISLYEKAER